MISSYISESILFSLILEMAPWPSPMALASWLLSPFSAAQPYLTPQPSVEDSHHTHETSLVRRPDGPDTQGTFSLEEVLSIAKIHPFYSNAQYPPDRDTIKILREYASVKADLKMQPVLHKRTLLAIAFLKISSGLSNFLSGTM